MKSPASPVRSSIEHTGATLRPRVSIKDDGEDRKVAAAANRGSISASGRGAYFRREGQRRSILAMCWPRFLGRRPRPKTSPAVCRAWPNCSRRESRRRQAVISEIDGEVSYDGFVKGMRKVIGQ